MASTTEEERLKAEIAKLSGAIQTHKQQQQHQPHQQAYQAYAGGYASRGRGYYAGAPGASYRGAYTGGHGGFHAGLNAGRGRGRGAAAVPQRNRTLILNDSNNKGAATGSASSTTASVSNAGDNASTAQAASTTSSSAPLPSSSTIASTAGATDGWIKRKSTHNMSLVSASTFQRTEPARLAALEATRKAKAEAKAAASSSASSAAGKKATRGKPSKPSSSVRRGDNMGEVVIDGVVFEFDPSGTKLVKKPVQPSTSDATQNQASSTSTATEGSTAVPLKTSINGQDYIRTKRGNLISAELLAKRKAQREAQAKMGRLDQMVGQISAIQATRNSSRKPRGSKTLDAKKARTLCTFFNKTGQCKRGLSCPYLHDSSKIALCPKVLRPAGCTLPKGTCPLSHTPRAERVPHCVHYLRSGKCRNGDECLYTHADLTDGVRTEICRDFSDYGWCERGRECQERHTYECPDFVEKGKCERKGCKLVHVIRASQPNGAEERGADMDAEDAGGGMQDGDLFMRDDAAAGEESAAEVEQPHGRTKRKRPLMQTELDDDQPVLPDDDDDDNDDGDDEEDEQVNFTNTNESRQTKRRKAKAFTQQKDFISFDDDEDEQDDDDQLSAEEQDESEQEVSTDDSEEEESDDEDGQDQDEDQDDDGSESVHSEDFEMSDAEQPPPSPEHDAVTVNRADPAGDDDDDDDDDDVVDRDL